MRRLSILALLVLAIGAALFWLSRQPVDLDALRALVGRLAAFRDRHPLELAGAAALIYVAVTALSLPLATPMTLAIGALFGFLPGLVITSFASTLGATLAFLLARWLFRDAVAARLGARLATVRDGFDRDGGFYLFTLRLIPAVPFFAVNLAMALTRIGWGRFWLLSQIGMLPGTAVYVNAGTRLAGLDSLRGLVSPGLIAAFALLGLFPWIARAGLALLRRHRRRLRWPPPKRFDRNLIVIGAGAAGLVAAYLAAAAKARVTLVESGAMGGDCLNHGCVPSKALIASARAAATIRHADRWGLTATEPQVPFPQVMQRLRGRHRRDRPQRQRRTLPGDGGRGAARPRPPDRPLYGRDRRRRRHHPPHRARHRAGHRIDPRAAGAAGARGQRLSHHRDAVGPAGRAGPCAGTAC